MRKVLSLSLVIAGTLGLSNIQAAELVAKTAPASNGSSAKADSIVDRDVLNEYGDAENDADTIADINTDAKSTPQSSNKEDQKSTSSAQLNQKQNLAVQLNLKQEDQRLYAYMIVKQSAKEAGHIRIEWTPNKGCSASQFNLAYQGKQFHTRAYRTIAHPAKNGVATCTGEWQVKVVDANGAELAKAVYNVKPVASDAPSQTELTPAANASVKN